MVSPKNYKGYDEKGELKSNVTAQDANTYINPADVQAKIDAVKQTVTDEMNKVASALQNVAPDANEAVIVQGTKMDQTIQETCDALKQLPDAFVSSISGIYDQAVAAHDNIQNKLNDQAYNSAWVSGVVNVR